MTDKPRLGLKPGSLARDPYRRPVRGGVLPQRPVTAKAPATPQNQPPNQPYNQPHQQPPTQRQTPPDGRPPHRSAGPGPGPGAGHGNPGNRGKHPGNWGDPPPQRPPAHRPRSAEFPTPPAEAEGSRVSKVLAERGLASRREADDWIAEGWVRVDGRLAVLGQRIQGHERIDIDPAARQQQRKLVTVLINKPIGLVSGQAEDGYEPASTLVIPQNRWPDDRGLPWRPSFGRQLAPAGRLDIDSTGLLVLTQDGRIARHLIGEDSTVEKEYLVRVQPVHEGSFRPEGLELLRDGLSLDGQRLKPAKVSWANEDQLRMVLKEGRKRQIRRMCELVGLQVVGLKRVRIGQVVLGKLPMGQWRLLRDDERF